MMTIKELREQRNIPQIELGKLIGVGQSSFAYKEKEGTFTYEEQQKLAKYLKVDMTTISWTKPIFQAKQTDEKDKTIQEQRDEIIRLQAEVKILKELLTNYTQNR